MADSQGEGEVEIHVGNDEDGLVVIRTRSTELYLTPDQAIALARVLVKRSGKPGIIIAAID